MNEVETVESGEVYVSEDMETGKGHCSKQEWLKARIKWNQRYIEDLQYMKKQEEKEADGRLRDGRRKWFNQEIEDAQQKITELDNELQELK